MSLALEPLRCDEALDLGRLIALLLPLLNGKRPPNHILSHIVLLAQVVELADLSHPLGTQATRNGAVGEAGNVVLSLPHDDEVEHAQVAVYDAATDRLSAALSLTARAVTRVALGEEELHAAVGEYALLHGEALLVVAPGDPDQIALSRRMEGGGERSVTQF